jgi:hypothetical protein
MTQGYWFNPLGIFTDGTCTVPKMVPVTVDIEGTNGLGDTVSCMSDNSLPHYYTRVSESAHVVFHAPCAVQTGATGKVTSAGLAGTPLHVFAASQQPCLSDFPFSPPDPCSQLPEWVGTYTET